MCTCVYVVHLFLGYYEYVANIICAITSSLSLYDNQFYVVSFCPISVMTVLLNLLFLCVFISGNYFL